MLILKCAQEINPRVLFFPRAHGHCPQEILKSYRKLWKNLVLSVPYYRISIVFIYFNEMMLLISRIYIVGSLISWFELQNVSFCSQEMYLKQCSATGSSKKYNALINPLPHFNRQDDFISKEMIFWQGKWFPVEWNDFQSKELIDWTMKLSKSSGIKFEIEEKK